MHGGRENKVKKETKQRAVPYFEQKKGRHTVNHTTKGEDCVPQKTNGTFAYMRRVCNLQNMPILSATPSYCAV